MGARRTALGARRSSGVVCFGRSGGVVCSGRTALGQSTLLWVVRSCALTLRMFFIPFHGQFWLSTFCHQSKNIYRFRVLYFSPLELIAPSHVCKIFRSLGKPVRNRHPPSVILFVLENFFSDCLGAGCLLTFARRTALGARRTDFLLLGSFQLGAPGSKLRAPTFKLQAPVFLERPVRFFFLKMFHIFRLNKIYFGYFGHEWKVFLTNISSNLFYLTN